MKKNIKNIISSFIVATLSLLIIFPVQNTLVSAVSEGEKKQTTIQAPTQEPKPAAPTVPTAPAQEPKPTAPAAAPAVPTAPTEEPKPTAPAAAPTVPTAPAQEPKPTAPAAAPAVPSAPTISYQTHVQNIGWQQWFKNGEISGTTGKSLRLEGLRVKISDTQLQGGVIYSTHVQNLGWQSNVSNGQDAGTTGRSLRLEAIKVALTGELANQYSVYYRSHVENFGWLDWAKDGEESGSAGYGLRVEGFELKLVAKKDVFSTTSKAFRKNPNVIYSSHIQNIGWQNEVSNANVSGTSGQALRLESLKVRLDGASYNGGIEYSTHIQNVGWTPYSANGNISGITGAGLRMEALKIRLTGEVAMNSDVYYRVHVQNIGWLDWTKNDLKAGTEGYSYRIEALQIMLVEKNNATKPQEGRRSFFKKKESVDLNAPFISQYASLAWNGCEGASLLEGLQALGYARDYNLDSFLSLIPVTGNPNTGYDFSPYGINASPNRMITTFPAPLAKVGSKFTTVRDISGASASDIKNELSFGRPVVVYVSSHFEPLRFCGIGTYGVFYCNLHVVLVDGYNASGYHIVDPIYGKFWVDNSRFESVYNVKKNAVAIG